MLVKSNQQNCQSQIIERIRSTQSSLFADDSTDQIYWPTIIQSLFLNEDAGAGNRERFDWQAAV
jgi:hypothetical protein